MLARSFPPYASLRPLTPPYAPLTLPLRPLTFPLGSPYAPQAPLPRTTQQTTWRYLADYPRLPKTTQDSPGLPKTTPDYPSLPKSIQPFQAAPFSPFQPLSAPFSPFRSGWSLDGRWTLPGLPGPLMDSSSLQSVLQPRSLSALYRKKAVRERGLSPKLCLIRCLYTPSADLILMLRPYHGEKTDTHQHI